MLLHYATVGILNTDTSGRGISPYLLMEFLMEKLFAPKPEGAFSGSRLYMNGVSFRHSGISGDGYKTQFTPIYISDLKYNDKIKKTYILKSLAGLIYVNGGHWMLSNIQFADYSGEGAIHNAVSRAKAYYSKLQVVYRDQEQLVMPTNEAGKVYIKEGAKVNLNLAAYQIVIVARVWALTLNKTRGKSILHDI